MLLRTFHAGLSAIHRCKTRYSGEMHWQLILMFQQRGCSERSKLCFLWLGMLAASAPPLISNASCRHVIEPDQGLPSYSDSTCQVSCQDPTRFDQCILLTSLLIDGSPCDYRDMCSSGRCQTGSLFDTAKAWYVQNLQISIRSGSRFHSALVGRDQLRK